MGAATIARAAATVLLTAVLVLAGATAPVATSGTSTGGGSSGGGTSTSGGGTSGGSSSSGTSAGTNGSSDGSSPGGSTSPRGDDVADDTRDVDDVDDAPDDPGGAATPADGGDDGRGADGGDEGPGDGSGDDAPALAFEPFVPARGVDGSGFAGDGTSAQLFEAAVLPPTAVAVAVGALPAVVTDCLLAFVGVAVIPDDIADGGCPELVWARTGDSGAAFARPPDSVEQVEVFVEGDRYYVVPRRQLQSVPLTLAVLLLAVAVTALTLELRRRRLGGGTS